MSGVEGGTENRRSNIRCRIPQRTATNRGRLNKFNNTIEPSPVRPKSAARASQESPPNSQTWTPPPPLHPVQLAYHTRIDSKPSAKRQPSIPIRNNFGKSRPGKQVITVPNVLQKQGTAKRVSPARDNVSYVLPDQETITKCEEQRIQHLSSGSNNSPLLNSNDEACTSCTHSDKIVRLKGLWQEKIILYENKKIQLEDLQRALLELYATLRLTHKEMIALGQKVKLPPSDDLRIMNVANLSPDQLLQICEGKLPEPSNEGAGNVILNIDVNLLYEMPAKILATCEQTLSSRYEMVFWFESIMSQKTITKNALIRKVEQFKLENNMFKSNLDNNKQEFAKNINEAVELLKKSVNGAVTNQLRSEELICKLSELSSTNEDLRKQLRTMENRISNRAKLEVFCYANIPPRSNKYIQDDVLKAIKEVSKGISVAAAAFAV